MAGVLAYNELKQHVPGVYVPERERKKGAAALLARASTVEGGVPAAELAAANKRAQEAGKTGGPGGASDAKNKA